MILFLAKILVTPLGVVAWILCMFLAFLLWDERFVDLGFSCVIKIWD